MADYIFTSGTCLKNELYDLIKNSFLSAGWVNESSNATTDFDVLTSSSESGDKRLVIQLRPLNNAGTASTNVITTDSHVMSYRLVAGYTPGAPGVAGTFARTTAESWRDLFLVPQAASTLMPGNTPINYKLHVNKNRLIISIEYPVAFSLGATTIYIGIPDITYCLETDSRGLIVVTSNSAISANNVHITDDPGELAARTTSTTRTLYCTLAPRNPNSANKIMLSEIFYGNTTEGIRGKLTGIYALLNSGVSTGDIVKIGTKSFYVVVNQTYSSTSFPSQALAFQIS